MARMPGSGDCNTSAGGSAAAAAENNGDRGEGERGAGGRGRRYGRPHYCSAGEEEEEEEEEDEIQEVQITGDEEEDGGGGLEVVKTHSVTPPGPRSHCQDTSFQPGWMLSPLWGCAGLDGDRSALSAEAEDETSCSGKDCPLPSAKHLSLRKRFLLKLVRATKSLSGCLWPV